MTPGMRVRVVDTNGESVFLAFIKRADSPSTLFYLDPPYVHATRASKGAYGAFEMTDADHVRLLDKLEKIKGKFVLSGYDNPVYQVYAKRNAWRKQTFAIPNHAAGGKSKRTMQETIWTNF